MDDPIYRQLRDEHLLVDEPGADDDLVETTDNSLRPDDAALEQPPQDPTWRPA